MRTTATIVGLAIACLGISMVAPIYYLYLANMLLIYAVLALGVDVLMGLSGQFAFSHMAFFGIGCYATALLNLDLGIPFLLALPIAVVMTAVVGVLVGFAAIRLNTIYLALATFAFAEGMRWTFNDWTSLTGGANGLRILPMFAFGIEITSDRQAFPLILAFAVVVLLATLMLHGSRFGRELVAVRESEHVSMASGINVRRTKISAFVVSAVYAGLAGGLYTLNHSFVSPPEFGFNGAVLILTMIVVGGMGTVPGVLLGVLIFGLLPTILQSTLRSVLIWQEFIYGAILTASVLLMPRGIWGAFKSLRGFRLRAGSRLGQGMRP
jgi:branched-chain amino acid transport system permease protein